jgi:hypothetical protein
MIWTIYYEYKVISGVSFWGVNIFRVDISTQQVTYDKTYIPYHHLNCITLHEDLGINLLPDGKIIISGSVMDAPGNSGFILKLDQNADSLWCKNYFFGPPNDGHCQLNDLLPTDDGGFLGVGFYLPDNDDIAAWMFKTDANGFVGIPENDPQEPATVKAFPNPAASHISFDFSALSGASSLRIYDHNGKAIIFEPISPGQTHYELQLEGYSQGIYFYEVLGEGGRLAAGKFVRVD